MRRYAVVLSICLAALVALVALVTYGWTHRYGAPTTDLPKPPAVLTVPFRAESPGVEDPDAPGWAQLPRLEVPLFHQVTETPWPTGLTPRVWVQAFHNGTDVYFRMEWDDDQADLRPGSGRFVDACAVAVVLKPGAPAQSLMMGFTERMNFWHWRADVDAEFWEDKAPDEPAHTDRTNPFEGEEVHKISRPPIVSAVADLVAEGPGSLTIKPEQRVQGRGRHADGRWRVVFRRALGRVEPEYDVEIVPGERGSAFAVWDGDQGDRGARKSISDWVILRIEPAPDSGPATGSIPLALPERATTRNRAPDAVARAGWDVSALVRSVFAAAADDADHDGEEPEPRVITIRARRFEYEPNEITLQKGEHVTFRLVSEDVTHGLYLDGYGLQLKARPGLAGSGTFVADRTGRFSFRCSETCGEFHPYMIGYLTVEPNRRFHAFAFAVGVAFLAALVFVFLRRSRGPARAATDPMQASDPESAPRPN